MVPEKQALDAASDCSLRRSLHRGDAHRPSRARSNQAGKARSRDRIRNEQVGINVERSFQCLSSDDHHSDAMADRAKYSQLRTINVSEV
jgi:hypothetical protein